MLKKLQSETDYLLSKVQTDFTRYLYDQISLSSSVVGVVGPKGVGKTTLLLQLMKNRLGPDDKALYVDVDELSMYGGDLVGVAKEWYRSGGNYLFLDEVHKLVFQKIPTYSGTRHSIFSKDEVKNRNAGKGSDVPIVLFLDYCRVELPGLRVMFAGASLGDVDGAFYELSRLADLHFLAGLSFREYLALKHQLYFPIIPFNEFIEVNRLPGVKVLNRIRPLAYFDAYLRQGHYPMGADDSIEYEITIRRLLDNVLTSDLAAVYRIDYDSVIKIKHILVYLAVDGPLKPNIEKLSDLAGTTRDSLLKFLKYLHKAGIIGWMTAGHEDINYFNKPDRLFINNSTLLTAISPYELDNEALYETFAFNQLRFAHQVNVTSSDAMRIDLNYEFSMNSDPSSARKRERRIGSLHYQLIQDAEKRQENTIPLWMLGFLY